VKQQVTRYAEATGTLAAINSANLAARVSGFLERIAYTAYKDVDQVKAGTLPFMIEPEP
jgi:hypothetical protein